MPAAEQAPAIYSSLYNEDGTLNSGENPARGGSLVSVLINGAGRPPEAVPPNLNVVIANLSCEFIDAQLGPFAGFRSVYRVRVRVPSGLAGYYAVAVQVKGIPSPAGPALWISR